MLEMQDKRHSAVVWIYNDWDSLDAWTQSQTKDLVMVVLLAMFLANVVHKDLSLSANTTHPITLKTTPLFLSTHKPKVEVEALDG